MDFESLNFSGGLGIEGNPIWFADKNGFEEQFVFTQFLKKPGSRQFQTICINNITPNDAKYNAKCGRVCARNPYCRLEMHT